MSDLEVLITLLSETCAPACHCIPDGYDPTATDFCGAVCPEIEDRKFVSSFTEDDLNTFLSFQLIEDVKPEGKKKGKKKGKKDILFYPEGCQPFPAVADKLGEYVDVCDEPYSTSDDAVCAFMYEPDDDCYGTMYRLETFKNKEKAEAKGGVVTHEGSCGACSSAQDLAVNLNPAIALITTGCGVANLSMFPSTPEQVQMALDNIVTCIQTQLGFTDDCAFVWASNTLNSFYAGCTSACLSYLGPCLDDPSSDSCSTVLTFGAYDGSRNSCDLNACLECDETESGPIFKMFSGRTRRNSGILTVTPIPTPLEIPAFAGLKRDCDSIANIAQDPCARNDVAVTSKSKKGKKLRKA